MRLYKHVRRQHENKICFPLSSPRLWEAVFSYVDLHVRTAVTWTARARTARARTQPGTCVGFHTLGLGTGRGYFPFALHKYCDVTARARTQTVWVSACLIGLAQAPRVVSLVIHWLYFFSSPVIYLRYLMLTRQGSLSSSTLGEGLPLRPCTSGILSPSCSPSRLLFNCVFNSSPLKI